MRRWIRTLLVFAVIASYVALAARLATRHPQLVDADAAILEGVAREALAGTTPGRQALVGSAWWGPLPMVLHLSATTVATPFLSSDGLLAGVPVALWLSALLVIAACLGLLRASTLALRSNAPVDRDRTPANAAHSPALPLALVAVLPAGLTLATGATAQALVFPLALFLVFEASSWLHTGQLRHLIPAAFAMAALLLCGAAAWGWVVFGAVAMLLGILARRALLRRLPALLLLGWLPAAYAFGVWCLLNWLILNDGLFFLRPLAALSPPAWPPFALALSSPWDVASVAACAVSALLGLCAADGRRVGYGLAGIAAAAWLWTLQAFGLGWAVGATRLLLQACALLSVVRLTVAAGRGNARRTLVLQAAAIALVVAFGGLRSSVPPGPDRRAADDETVAAVARHVRERTPYAKVFVCGYKGLGLLRGDRHDDLFAPAMDLHLGGLRNDYWGQTLFVLVRKPVRAAKLESIVWRSPDFHLLGSARTLLSADFGDWRLYELVTAPTLRELQR